MYHNRKLKHFSMPRRHEDEDVVQCDLAYTPSQMMRLVENGFPVTAHQLNPDLFFDGVAVGQGTFDLPLDRTKGVDVADCWQASQTARKKAKDGLRQDVFTYGKEPVVQKGE